jgi:hypothetical protein
VLQRLSSVPVDQHASDDRQRRFRWLPVTLAKPFEPVLILLLRRRGGDWTAAAMAKSDTDNCAHRV